MIEIQKNACFSDDTIIASLHRSRYLMAPHVHQMSELVYVLEGEFTVISPGRQEIARAGDIVIVRPYRPHGYYTEKGKEVGFWMLLFEDTLINDLVYDSHAAKDYSNSVFTPSEELRVFLSTRMIDTNEKKKKLDANELRNIKATLYPIFDEYMTRVPILRENKRIHSNSVAETFRYLSEHFRENVTLKEVASAIGYSESHISHSLSSMTGMNFRSILNSIRISHAKALLLHTSTNVLMVSVECGFATERSFHRAFQALIGMTPSEYRERYSYHHINSH